MSYQDDCMLIKEIRHVAGIKRGYGMDTVILRLDDLDVLIRRIETLEKQRERLFGWHVFYVGASEDYENTIELTTRALTAFNPQSPTFNDQIKLVLERFDART